jgi:indole-3-glycerol phosphate synthase
MNRLDPIIASTRAEVNRRRAATPVDSLLARADELRDFAGALARPGLSLIAEHKRSSPSAGLIREGLSLADVVAGYERAGAAALSILTEGENFGGSLDDLRLARASSRLPILRKDFVVDPYQVHESLSAGADAILLIVAALTPARLDELHGLATDLGLDVLVEVHDASELETAKSIGASVIGVNNRDLTTLQVDTARTYELLPLMPAEVTVVAESGFGSRSELERLAAAGVDGVLIGEALMRSPDIELACRELISGL